MQCFNQRLLYAMFQLTFASNSMKKQSHNSHAEIFATILTLLFQVPGLEINKPLDHFETFSGKMSVTKGEWNDSDLNPKCVFVGSCFVCF